MKKFFIIFAWCFFSYASDAIITQANQEYKLCNFKKALSLYEKLTPKSPQIWFYMGNCYYQLDDTLNALLYWQRAYQKGSGIIAYHSAYNYELVARKLGISDHQSILYSIKKIIHITPLFILQILFFCVFSVFLLLSYRLYVKSSYGNVIAASIMMLIVFGALQSAYDQQQQKAFITAEKAIVYAGPSTEFHDIGTITAGLSVTVCDEQKNWIKISQGKHRGWVQKEQITVL